MAVSDSHSIKFHCLETHNQGLSLSSSALHSFMPPFAAPSTTSLGDSPCAATPGTISNSQYSLSKPSEALEEPLLVSSHHRINENRFFSFKTPAERVTRRPIETKHIPRPPNAFMLYRSDLLKRRTIPREVEHRQQNLSRIAGQCWNLLTKEEKDVWHNKAAVVRAAHYTKYPFYKFRPHRKTAAKSSVELEEMSSRSDNVASQDNMRSQREKSKGVVGMSVGPIRRTRTACSRSRALPPVAGMFAALHTPLSPSLIPSTTASLPSSLSSSPSLSPLSLLPLLPPFTIQGQPSCSSFPTSDPSRLLVDPGESMLGLQPEPSGSLLADDTESFSNLIQDFDIAPATAVFHENDHNRPCGYNVLPRTAYLGLEQLQLPHSSLHHDYSYSLPHSCPPRAPYAENFPPFCPVVHDIPLSICQPSLNPSPAVAHAPSFGDHFRA